jgi:hypothetical protein
MITIAQPLQFGSGHGGWEARSWAPAAAILYRRGRNRVENAMGAKQTCVYQKCARLCVSPQHTNTHTHTRTHTARVYCAMQLAVSSKRCCERSLAPWLPAGRRCSPTAIPFAHAYMRAYTRSLQPSTHAHTNTHLHTHTHSLSLFLTHNTHTPMAASSPRSHLHVENVSPEEVTMDVLWGTESSRRVLAPMTNASIEGRPQGKVEATVRCCLFARTTILIASWAFKLVCQACERGQASPTVTAWAKKASFLCCRLDTRMATWHS